MYKFGPYGPNHATAATFAFRKELLKQTRYDDHASLAEEKQFLKNYTIPFVQLDPVKSILVFSHVHNSFDKKTLLENPSPLVTVSEKSVDEFVKEPEIKTFFMETIDALLDQYQPGDTSNKPDVLKQMEEMKIKREEMMRQHQLQLQQQQQQIIQHPLVQNILQENNDLRAKVEYLEKKISEIIQKAMQEKLAIKNSSTKTDANNV